jgi:hypothetical protein
MLIKIDVGSLNFFVAIIAAAIFRPAEEVVGKRVIEAPTDRPAVEGLVSITRWRINGGTRGGPSGRGEDQGAVDGIADATDDRAGEVCSCLSRRAEDRQVLLVPIVGKVAFDADPSDSSCRGTRRLKRVARFLIQVLESADL